MADEKDFLYLERLSEAHLVDLERLYRNEWWTSERERDEIRAIVAGSSLVVGFAQRATNRLVAFARVLSDGAAKAIIFDVIVDPEIRGRALGRALMERIVSHPSLTAVNHLELYCLPELVPFYRRFGFTEEVGGVLLMRRSQSVTLKAP